MSIVEEEVVNERREEMSLSSFDAVSTVTLREARKHCPSLPALSEASVTDAAMNGAPAAASSSCSPSLEDAESVVSLSLFRSDLSLSSPQQQQQQQHCTHTPYSPHSPQQPLQQRGESESESELSQEVDDQEELHLLHWGCSSSSLSHVLSEHLPPSHSTHSYTGSNLASLGPIKTIDTLAHQDLLSPTLSAQTPVQETDRPLAITESALFSPRERECEGYVSLSCLTHAKQVEPQTPLHFAEEESEAESISAIFESAFFPALSVDPMKHQKVIKEKIDAWNPFGLFMRADNAAFSLSWAELLIFSFLALTLLFLSFALLCLKALNNLPLTAT